MDESKNRYCFLVDWFDVHAQLTRRYQLFYYPFDHSIEMYDVKNKRTFLKRMKSQVSLDELYLGASVTLYSRQLHIVELGDEYTISVLGKEWKKALLVVLPALFPKVGEIMEFLSTMKASFAKLKMVDFKTAPPFGQSSGNWKGNYPSVVFEIVKHGSMDDIQSWVSENKEIYFNSSPYVHQELDLVFGYERTAKLVHSTLALIKPHSVNAGQSGSIVDAILKAGFNITDMNLVHLERGNAEEFLEVYRGIVPEYHLLLDQFTSGPLIALEISGSDDSIVSTFRDFVGPNDPELAVKLRPQSLRARFGVDKVRNGIHATDLPEDGALETSYFFKILD